MCHKDIFLFPADQIKLFFPADIENGSLSGTFLVWFCHFELLLMYEMLKEQGPAWSQDQLLQGQPRREHPGLCSQRGCRASLVAGREDQASV